MFTDRYWRPGIISRLGWLILAQVVFLFGALGIVLFAPGATSQHEPSPLAAQSFIKEVEARLNLSDTSNGSKDSAVQASIIDLLDRSNSFHNVAEYELSNGIPRKIRECAGSSSEHRHNWSDPAKDSAHTADFLRFIASQPRGYLVTLADYGYGMRHYYSMSRPSGASAILVVDEVDDVIRSSRSHLQWVFLVLFLVSALLSLLIVHLLWTRFKEPLDHLTKGLEQNAPGEEYVTLDQGNEMEVSRLAAGFNRISEAMRKEHAELQMANLQLQQASEALAESQQFFTAIIESSPSPVIVVDADDRIVLFNKASAAEFARPADEVIGMNIAKLVSLPSSERLGNGAVLGFETVCWRGDGGAFPAYMLTNTVDRADGTPWVRLYVIRDIAESRAFQDMMVRLDRMATRGEMAGDIGHEINNFLAVLLGNIELLPRVIARNDEPGIAKKLDVMKVNVEKIARFADGLMDNSHEDIVFEPANMNQIVENVVEFVKHQNRFDGVDWIIQLQSDLPQAEMDAGQIQQVLVNLLYNAAESVGGLEGNHVISISTHSAERGGTSGVRVDVCDNGPGVLPSKESLVFRTRFTTKKKGHGIGLITCRRILDGHGGWIGYHKDVETNFWFELPLVHRDHVERNEPSIESTPAAV